MRPDLCGTGRNLDTLHPGDRREIIAFGEWLAGGGAHIRAVRDLMAGKTRPQLIAAPPYRVDDFVKITDGVNAGRWGIVTAIEDYRHEHPGTLEFLIMVSLLTTRPGMGIVAHPPGPVPFEPWELAPLFAGEGDWVRRGRVVSEKHWPPPRTGLTDAS